MADSDSSSSTTTQGTQGTHDTHDTHDTSTKVEREQQPSRLVRLGSSARGSFDVRKARTLVARIVWAVCVVFALALAIAALLIALDANPENDAVRFFIDFADEVDLGVFDLMNPIKDLDVKQTDVSQDVKTALFNYGICAVVWLIGGRIVERVIRP